MDYIFSYNQLTHIKKGTNQIYIPVIFLKQLHDNIKDENDFFVLKNLYKPQLDIFPGYLWENFENGLIEASKKYKLSLEQIQKMEIVFRSLTKHNYINLPKSHINYLYFDNNKKLVVHGMADHLTVRIYNEDEEKKEIESNEFFKESLIQKLRKRNN
jgi:hypothetical protein